MASASCRRGSGPTALRRSRLTTTRVRAAGTASASSASARTSRCTPTGSRRADHDDEVRRSQGRQRHGVAPGGHGVEGQLLVLLQGEAAVDDGDLGEPPGHGPDLLDGRVPQLRPPVGPGDAGEDPQPRRRPGGELASAGRSSAPLLAEPGGGGEARCLVEETEHLGDHAAVDVSVGQQGLDPEGRELVGEADGHRRAARRAGRSPHRDQPALLVAAGQVDVVSVDVVSVDVLPVDVGANGALRRETVQRRAPARPAVAVHLVVHGGGHGVGHCRDRRVGREHVLDAELAQPPFARLVARREEPDDRDPGTAPAWSARRGRAGAGRRRPGPPGRRRSPRPRAGRRGPRTAGPR